MLTGYRSFHLPFPSIPNWVDELARRNGCPAGAAKTPLDLPTSGEVSGVRYTDCAADVVFYTIAGGGHGWPGGGVIPEYIVGHTTQDITASEVMWDFFRQHPLPEP